MSEKEFYDLLIEMIRVGSYVYKSIVLESLKRSSLNCDKTYEYTCRKWNHYKEYIYITTSPSDMMTLIKHKDYIEDVIEKIYPVNDDYQWELFGVEIKPGKVEHNEYVSQEIHFDEIQEQIIEELNAAKYTIWIAMAWFTNEKLYNVLVEKKKQGINIQIILDDNERNRRASFDLSREFETYWIKIESLYPNIMHDKFCIIDLRKVIQGTFNWTNAANYNKETISIDENTTTARTFADEFLKLKTGAYGLVR